MGTPEGLQELSDYYDKLYTYKNRPIEDLINIFNDDDADFEEREWVCEALIETKDSNLPDLFYQQIENTKIDDWRWLLIQQSGMVSFKEKRPKLKELVFKILKETSSEEGICKCLMRFCYLTSDVSSLDRIYPWLEKGDENRRNFIYRSFVYCKFRNLSKQLIEFIKNDCENYLKNLPPVKTESEEISIKRLCFNYAMEILYHEDHDEFIKNCEILKNNEYKWLAEYLEYNIKRKDEN